MPGKVQFHRIVRHTLGVCLVSLSLSACSMGSDKLELDAHGSAKEAIDAATGPLEDLNLRKREIPPLLASAARNPYAKPEKAKCDVVRTEVAQLDELLGPDIEPKEVEVASADDNFMGISDVEMPDRQQMISGAGSMVHDGIIGAIRSRTNILPFRSIIRKISGADRHQRHLAEAYEAGKLRRAYLKGYAMERFGKKCLDKPIAIEVKEDHSEADKSPKGDPNE